MTLEQSRNIRPIPIKRNHDIDVIALSRLTGERREIYISHMINPGVMFTKEGERENRIRELRLRRWVRYWELQRLEIAAAVSVACGIPLEHL